jgi:DNA-binding response OmpR family regulator
MSPSIGVRTPCVVIIEDHPDAADSLALFLRAGGACRPYTAYDGQAGVDLALSLRPAAVLCDLGLPKKNGFMVAEELCRRMPDRPLLVAISAYSDERIRGRALWSGFDHFFAKPADPWEVRTLLSQHLASSPRAWAARTIYSPTG